MYIDNYNLKPLDALAWHSVPSDEYGVLKDECYKVGEYELIMLKNPITMSNENLVEIEYSMVAKKNGKIILAINLEKDDLKGLAASFGCSLKDVQEDYKTKSYYGPKHCVLYSHDEKEDMGVYTGDTDLMSLRIFFMDILLDTLDCLDEVEKLYS
ncbi:MAG: hypothetical protein ACPKMZ_13140 [Pleomorphochaeta sp.]